MEPNQPDKADNKTTFGLDDFTELKKKYEKLTPDLLDEGAVKLEYFLYKRLLPFIAAHGTIISTLTLSSEPDELSQLFSWGLLLIILVSGGVLIQRNSFKTYTDTPYLGTWMLLFAALILALFDGPIWIGISLLPISILFWTILKQNWPSELLVFPAMYLPFIMYLHLEEQHILRLTIELVFYVAVFSISLRHKWKMIPRYASLGIFIAGFLEFVVIQAVNDYLFVMLLAFTILLVIYEARQTTHEVSDVRSFIGQGITNGILFFWIGTFMGESNLGYLVWTGILFAYNLTFMIRKQNWQGARIAWLSIAITISLFAPEWPVDKLALGTALVLNASVLQLIAMKLSNRFISRIGLIQILIYLVCCYNLEDIGLNIYLLVSVLFTGVYLWLYANRRDFGLQSPWWHGFVSEQTAVFIKKTILSIFAQIARIPFALTVFGWFIALVAWIKFIKKGEIYFEDFIRLAGTLTVIIILHPQLFALTLFAELPLIWSILITHAAVCVFGLYLLESGIRNDDNYYRFMGLIICTLPAFISVQTDGLESYASAVALMIASCFAYFAWRGNIKILVKE